jgi:hypothetical protein
LGFGFKKICMQICAPSRNKKLTKCPCEIKSKKISVWSNRAIRIRGQLTVCQKNLIFSTWPEFYIVMLLWGKKQGLN